jgi:hypothetical protein
MKTRFTLSVVLIALSSYLLGLFLPWWSIAITSFLIILMRPMRAIKSFLAGFLGIFVLWIILALWINIRNEGILAGKIAELLPLGGNSVLLIIVTGLAGAILGGLSALTASLARTGK